MPTLGVVMIVRNEAACLGECLASVRGIADELVVVDTGSTDGTISIARESGAQVFEIPWENDFAAARNRSLALATSDWLLHMDADEVLDAAGADRIRALVDMDGGGADAVEVTLANYSDDPRSWRWRAVKPDDPMARGYSGYVATELLRLFRNGRGYHYREPVHENITESVVELGGCIRREDVVIHHYGFGAKDSAKADAKADLYLEIARKKAQERPDDPKAWHDLAEQSLAREQIKEAESACRRALALSPNNLNAASTLATILLNRGDLDDAKTLLEGLESVGISPPHVVTALAAIAIKQGRVDEAVVRTKAVAEVEPENLMGRLYAARALDVSGQASGARAHLEAAMRVAPRLQEVADRVTAHDLRLEGEAKQGSGDLKDALECLVQALRLDGEDPLIHKDLGEVLRDMGAERQSRESFERAERLAPGIVAPEDRPPVL